MYIQNSNGELPFTLPKGYSGNAFAPTPAPPPPPEEQETATITPTEAPSDREPVQKSEESATAPAFAPHREEPRGGLLERLPFLSSLLPPPRKKHGGKGELPQWAVIGIILLLLLDSPENDLLPFLLILLLWD